MRSGQQSGQRQTGARVGKPVHDFLRDGDGAVLDTYEEPPRPDTKAIRSGLVHNPWNCPVRRLGCLWHRINLAQVRVNFRGGLTAECPRADLPIDG
jgi:hypothetical protein